MRRLRPAALLLIALVGCGPSLRRTRLSEAYFERCYAGDRDADATDPERRACWRAWLEHYRDGQPIERVDYASERVATLDPERAAILAVALTDEGLDEVAEPGLATPATTPDVEAMGATLDPEREAELHRRHRPLPPRTAAPTCAAACEPAWVACIDACAEGDRGCRNACALGMRTCARGCF